MRLKIVHQLLLMRDEAMERARRCRAIGAAGVRMDVSIARRANRLAIRTLKWGA